MADTLENADADLTPTDPPLDKPAIRIASLGWYFASTHAALLPIAG